MAAKSKKRLSKNENKLNKLDKLQIKDVICSICQSILIEPVTLPCYHNFCEHCFNGSIENNALCCPLCRLRIGSWVRTATKQKSLVNIQLWNFIQNKFPEEVNKKINGEDIPLSPEKIVPRLSKPGEIRSEYEAELQRLRAERLKLEQDHIHETVVLIQKLKEEEEEAHKKYLESLKQDEMLAKKLQEEQLTSTIIPQIKLTKKTRPQKTRHKSTTIENYLTKSITPQNNSQTNVDAKTDEFVDKTTSVETHNEDDNKSTKLYLAINTEKKGFWNKENGKISAAQEHNVEKSNNKNMISKTKNGMQSLLVSLPLPSTGLLQHKNVIGENRNVETDSVDSMQQELCYFKPIEGRTPSSFGSNKSLPLRVPSIRIETKSQPPAQDCTPTREQYFESLCRLRQFSLAKKLPSAFVCALSLLHYKKESPLKFSPNLRSKMKRTAPPGLDIEPSSPKKERIMSRHKQNEVGDNIAKEIDNSQSFLRRTRSMGSFSKAENETTPKKRINDKKSESEKKPRLRSEMKKYAKKDDCIPPIIEETPNKVGLAVKNLSSPLENCGVKHILQEQLRIEKLIQQEKHDYELACKMDAEWNGRRQPRRAATKRQVTLNYALRPAKKLKV